MAVYLIVSGGLSVAMIVNQDIKAGTVDLIGTPIAVFFYGGMCLAGIGLLARWVFGPWLGLLIVAPQVLFLRLAYFSFTLYSFPVVELKLWPYLGFSATAGAFITVSFDGTAQPIYLGINLIALPIVVGLIGMIRHGEPSEGTNAAGDAG